MWQYLVFLGAGVGLLGTFAYIRDTLKGETKPNRMTWLMWAVSPLIATGATISKGFSLSVLPVFISGFGPLLVFIASFKNRNSYWKLRKLDYVCGFFSALALIFWIVTKEANVAIFFAVLSDGMASLPTLIKAWGYPETETVSAYLGGFFTSLTSFAAIRVWGFSELAFPIYLLIINSLLIFSVLNKNIFKRK